MECFKNISIIRDFLFLSFWIQYIDTCTLLLLPQKGNTIQRYAQDTVLHCGCENVLKSYYPITFIYALKRVVALDFSKRAI